MSIINRIEDFINRNKLSIRAFEKKVGMSNGVLHNAIKNNKDIRASWVSIIIDVYPEINAEWLLTGKGEMTKTDLQPQKIEDSKIYDLFSNELKREINDLKRRIQRLEDRVG
jgi:hypothetical protein|tara:strand:+ start:651 stop:986 length:336 start_codon:yes stop_codon:yes gene_type:complete